MTIHGNLSIRPIVFFVVALLFAIAHKFAYTNNFGALILIFLTGIFMHSIGFYFPSASIIFHYLFNIIVEVRGG